MQAKLFCKTGSLDGVECTITDEVVIGRNPACSLQLQPPVIARKHARIYFDAKADSFFLEDLGSRNGTELDGIRVSKPERLDRLHIVTFARQFDFIFQVVDEAAAKPSLETKPPSPQPSPPPAPPAPSNADRTMIERAPGAPSGGEADTRPAGVPADIDATIIESPVIGADSRPDSYVLDFASTGGQKGKVALEAGNNVIGRAAMAGDVSVSREHAKITVGATQITVMDLGSRNGTFVDGSATQGEVVVTEASTLKFGSVMAKLVRCPG